jgi:hypothetical protein
VETAEACHEVGFVLRDAVSAADQEFCRCRNAFAVDDAKQRHVRVSLQVLQHSDDQCRITRVKHVVERDHALGMQHRLCEFEIVAQARRVVLAVDMDEASVSARQPPPQVIRIQLASVGLPRLIAAGIQPRRRKFPQ